MGSAGVGINPNGGPVATSLNRDGPPKRRRMPRFARRCLLGGLALAIGILVDRHRAEFDELLTDMVETVPLVPLSFVRPKRGKQKW